MTEHKKESMFDTLSDGTHVHMHAGTDLCCDAGRTLDSHTTNGPILKKFPRATWKCFDCHQEFYGTMDIDDTRVVSKLIEYSYIAYHTNQLRAHESLLKSILLMEPQ